MTQKMIGPGIDRKVMARGAAGENQGTEISPALSVSPQTIRSLDSRRGNHSSGFSTLSPPPHSDTAGVSARLVHH